MRWYCHINQSSGLPIQSYKALWMVHVVGEDREPWLGNIEKWTGRTAIEIHCATENRKEWRKITFESSHATLRCPGLEIKITWSALYMKDLSREYSDNNLKCSERKIRAKCKGTLVIDYIDISVFSMKEMILSYKNLII